MYAVTLNGKFIGYTQSKVDMQKRINEYIKNGHGESNIAFVDVPQLPDYSLCLLKKDIKSSDDKIFNKIKNESKTYYKYYAILEGTEEKYYVENKEEAEDIINKLRTKRSSNSEDIAYSEVHYPELKTFSNTDAVVTALYKKQKSRTVVTAASYSRYNGTTIADAPSGAVLGISLTKPVSGIITSRFGQRGSETHTGLDIAAPVGTTIYASSSGTVEFSGNGGTGYGNYIKISHGNGVETLYAHCNNLYVQAGETITQGQAIATIGLTGRTSGSHLHFEVRINGTYSNPQNYLY